MGNTAISLDQKVKELKLSRFTAVSEHNDRSYRSSLMFCRNCW